MGRVGQAGGPVWEDEHHLLLLARAARRRFGGDGLRVDVRTGAFEQSTLGVPHWRATLVEAL